MWSEFEAGRGECLFWCCNDAEIVRVHRAVLSWFSRDCNSVFEQRTSFSIPWHSKVFKMLLMGIYMGSVEVDLKEVGELISLAEYLGVVVGSGVGKCC
jgi:hypothetical protein